MTKKRLLGCFVPFALFKCLYTHYHNFKTRPMSKKIFMNASILIIRGLPVLFKDLKILSEAYALTL